MRISEPETSFPRLGFVIALLVLGLVLLTVWVREGETGPLHSAQSGVHAVATPFKSVGEVVTQPFRSFARWTSDIAASRSELTTLKRQNTELRSRLTALEEARLENLRLRALVGLAQPNKRKVLAANVIGRPAGVWEGVVTIDRGSDDGVEAGMAVLGPAGLIGRTIEVTRRTSRVQLITDQRSGVAVVLQGSRAPGVLSGSIEGELKLDFVSRETTVKPGAVVVTSGIGGVYPKGLPVGEVVKVRADTGGVYQDIEVRPTAKIAGIEEVLVLLERPPVPDVGASE